jgi:hypothetical protein
MPAEVPEFKYGKIKGVTTSELPDAYNWTVVYDEVPADAVKKYNDEPDNLVHGWQWRRSGWCIKKEDTIEMAD